ncbi:hypothetical protein [Brevibacillus daliensis]|uniref:hypothetical protein n=1 Tax=Brevibacillus daliensis TaxID=2892995 RepID=UPI001E36F282|nr:hypothetical protein [Brevibacillus daliensis]
MSKSDTFNRFILVGILICLVWIASNPVPSNNSSYQSPDINFPPFPETSNVVQLDTNRFAIVDKEDATITKIVVVEYDEKTNSLKKLTNTSVNFDLEFIFE